MDTVTTDGPPWHCHDAPAPAAAEQAPPIVPPAPRLPKNGCAARIKAPTIRPKSAHAGAFLPRLDRFVIALTVITAMSAIMGAQGQAASHSYEFTNAATAASAR